MDIIQTINNTNKYLTNTEKIKYAAYLVCGILSFQLLFKKVENKLSLLIQVLIIGGLVYFILQYDIRKKKQKEQEFEDYSEYEAPILLKDLLKKDKDAFDIYKNLLDLRYYNDILFDNSVVRYVEFLYLKDLILHGNSENVRGLYETCDTKIDLCLNELLAVSKNISDEDSLRIQSGVRKLYRLFYEIHMLEIIIYLKKIWKSSEITVNSFPINFETTAVKGDVTKDPFYNQHYSVY
jgi:hypothetical protein